MSQIENEYYLTSKHFGLIDIYKKLSESESNNNSESDSESNNNSDSESESESEFESDSDSDSDSDSESESESKSESNSESNNKSDSNQDNNSESESESDISEEMNIDKDNLFNTKTNGHEFYGEVLKNKYLILKKLGYGSFSSVWMSYDIENNILVAIKIINPQDYKEGIIELQTYKKIEKLNNKYLLTMIECFQLTPIHSKYYKESYMKKNKKKNHIIMVLPLMACSTYDLLKCIEYDDGLPLEVCKNIIYQTLLGIKELEKHNLMHTDLKPENILVCGLNREAEILLKTIHDINIKNVHKIQFEKMLKEKLNLTSEEKWVISYKLYKEITKTIISFMKNEMSDIKQQMKLCKVSSKYIKDIQIKICDFNLVINCSENLGNTSIEIQTRYYRAPEIIIKAGLHKKTDYWSIGCILFELLTGEILFNPEKNKLISRDIHHMYLIEELVGPTSKNLLAISTNYNKLYDKKGYLLNIGNRVKRWQLKEVLKENHNNLALSDKLIFKIINYINATLNIDPNNRPNLKKMIDSILIINN